jgi:hypothetical protein
MSRESAVRIVIGYRLEGRGVGVRVPIGARFLSHPRRPNGPGAHPASYPMGTGGYFPRGKAAEA